MLEKEVNVNSWRNSILKEFIPNVSKLTLVSDPDSLLTEEKMAIELRKRGFDLIEYSDPVEFRYAYESQYRTIWDSGKQTDLVVILRLQNADLSAMPYDLLQAGRKLSFSLGEIFPHLSYPVIEQIDRSLLDSLFEAQNKTSPDRMGDNATKDFILRHVFKVAAELISTDVELLRFLLRLHYGKLSIPSILSDRLVDIFKNNASFKEWDISRLITDAEHFFLFIQERWPIYLESLKHNGTIQDAFPGYTFKTQGPAKLPFNHQDIRVYIDNLFVERKLIPVDFPDIDVEKDSWILSGIKADKSDDDDIRISRLFELVKTDELSMESRYTEWITFAMKWAELSALIHTTDKTEYHNRYYELSQRVNDLFANWLKIHYASLINLPPSIPAMLHHVTRYLARYVEDKKCHKIALVLIDGLSLDQWITVRNIIQKQNRDIILRESATFSWIPTLTSVSRQALFSGKAPFYFPSSIHSTNSEEKLWKQFWQGYNIPKQDIAYIRGLGDGNAETTMEDFINPEQTKIAGLVIDKIDKIMHGMQLGAAGMHNQINQWCQNEYLISLLNYLISHNYEIWITSDHGNIESVGKGCPLEGAIADNRGERVRIYPTPELRSRVSSNFSFAYEWQPSGLPDNYYPLIATGNDAFIREGLSVVSHGGISIEEVIVPLIKIERKID